MKGAAGATRAPCGLPEEENTAIVPGMTERERLAADVRRCAWLADATLGPAR